MRPRTGTRAANPRGSGGGGGSRPFLLATVVAAVLVASLVGGADARELDVAVAQTKGVGEDSNEDLRMAGVRFDEPLPRYLTPAAMVSVGIIVGYMYVEGLLAVFFCGAILQFAAFLFYLFAALGADAEESTWQYGLANAKPILSNRGAVGGLYFSLAFWGYALMGGVLGEVISWATLDLDHGGRPGAPHVPYDRRHRHLKMATMKELTGRGFARLCCPPSLARDTLDDLGAEQLKSVASWGEGEDETKAAMGQDDTYATNACVATTGGEELTWGVALDHILVVFFVAAAVGPGMDVWQLPGLEWLGVLILAATMALVLVLYQYYSYGEAVDYPISTSQAEIVKARDRGELTPSTETDNVRRVWTRLAGKVMVLYPPFVHIFLFNVARAITASAMGATGAYVRVRYAQNAVEARYLANQNLLLQFVADTIACSVLLVVAVATYYVIIKGAVKAP